MLCKLLFNCCFANCSLHPPRCCSRSGRCAGGRRRRPGHCRRRRPGPGRFRLAAPVRAPAPDPGRGAGCCTGCAGQVEGASLFSCPSAYFSPAAGCACRAEHDCSTRSVQRAIHCTHTAPAGCELMRLAAPPCAAGASGGATGGAQATATAQATAQVGVQGSQQIHQPKTADESNEEHHWGRPALQQTDASTAPSSGFACRVVPTQGAPARKLGPLATPA